jgi:hypothetical protein
VDFPVYKKEWMKMKALWMKNRQITNKTKNYHREISFHLVSVLSFLELNSNCF